MPMVLVIVVMIMVMVMVVMFAVLWSCMRESKHVARSICIFAPQHKQHEEVRSSRSILVAKAPKGAAFHPHSSTWNFPTGNDRV